MPDIDKFFRILNETKEPAYDVETNGLDWKSCYTVGYSVSNGQDSEYIPVRHMGGNNINDINGFESNLNSRINSHGGKIIAWNAKFDMHFSENHGIKFANNVIDGMVYEALLNENKRSYALKNCLKEHGIEHKSDKVLYEHISQQFGCPPTRDAMGQYYRLAGNDPLAVAYACDDTRTTKLRYEQQKKEIYAQQLDLVSDIENQLTYVLQKMERRGIIINQEECNRVKKEVDELYWEAYAKIPVNEDEFGIPIPINVRSSKDLKEYFEYCEITDWPLTAPTERFPDGQASFNKQYLSTNQEGLNILNVRKLLHLQNGFLKPIDKFIHKERIHTTFNQTRGETHGTRSGRLSSSWPNMQQVPKRDEQLGKIYRRMFVPLRDYIFVEYDYSQAEPRLYTHYSGEPALMEGYLSNPPIDMYDVIGKYIHKDRPTCKTIGLGIMYTMGAEKLSIQLRITYDEALSILKQLTKIFPRMLGRDRNNPGFTEKAARVAEERGYVKTILGRRSRFDNPRFSYRAANRIIQGGSSDIMKYKMVEIDRYLVSNNLEEVCQMVLTIHDSILFMMHKDYIYLIPIIKDILERLDKPPFNLRVPFVVDYKIGKNWCDATYGEQHETVQIH